VSGALGVIAAPSVERTSFTVGLVGGTTYGMSSGAAAVAMHGATLLYVDFDTASPLLRLQLQPGDLTQSAFKLLIVEDGTPNTFQSFTSSSATFSDLGATVQWTWAPSTLWAAGDVGEVKRVILVF
jgi:hypothetical protein